MKQHKLKSLALLLGSSVLLATGLNSHAESSKARSDAGAADQGRQEKSGSVGQYVDDATITTRVKARFARESSVSASRIEVDTVKGIVELSGKVESEAERSKAISIARGVPDVLGVRNNLTIEGTAKKPAKSGAPNAPS